MSVPFDFLPRIVAKHAKPWQGISSFSPSPEITDSEPNDDDDDDDSDTESLPGRDKVKGKERATESQSNQSALTQDIASLISLALADYNIWIDPDLRSKLDVSLNDEASPGFVPINYLLRRTPFRGSLPPTRRGTAQHLEPSETDVVKALRTHANDILDVRMRLSTSSSVWYGTGKTSRKKDVGGYEVRRKDWSSLLTRPSRGWTRARWDDLTIYMEGIPPPYRTLGGITRFAEMLLLPETAPCFCVQHVSLPPHYLDRSGDVPKCRGYALVTFSSPSQVEAFLHAWPWTRRDGNASKGKGASQAIKDALKYGLRTISKARWDALNEEYLAYKQILVEEMSTHTTEIHLGAYQDEQQGGERDGEPQMQRRTTRTSSYPFDCLVFARNVHPETNKTALKTLFGRAFQDNVDKPIQSQVQARLSGAGLDYVDFNKGMDTCYLRLASPQHATCLVAYFSARGVVQADGLDVMGRAPSQDDKPIAMELVQGIRESLYWENVPGKVRRQAVDKVVKAGVESASSMPHTNTTLGSRSKKRMCEP